MARWATASDARLGRVVRVDRGLVSVLTESGPHRVSLGARVLAGLAADPTDGPCTGDWCVLRDWPDRRSTLEALLPAADGAAAGRRGGAEPWSAALRQHGPRRGGGRAAAAAGPLPRGAAGGAGLGERRAAAGGADQVGPGHRRRRRRRGRRRRRARRGRGGGQLGHRTGRRGPARPAGGSAVPSRSSAPPGTGSPRSPTRWWGPRCSPPGSCASDGRGRHTSVRRELVPLPGGGA